MDRGLGPHLASYVDSHVQLGSTLAEAKAEMDTAAKAARQKVKAQQTSKPDQTVAKQDKEAGTAIATEMMPSLFGPQPPSAEPTQATNAEERKNRP